MCKWYKEMSCYIVAKPTTGKEYGSIIEKRAKLENSFRHYAAVFSKVKLIVDPKQEKDMFLSFPRILDEETNVKPEVSIQKALEDADSDAVFIGTTDIYDFPISLLANLIKKYNGEKFMGYQTNDDSGNLQQLFGIYKKGDDAESIESLDFDSEDVTLLSLPFDIDSSCIGL